MRCLQKYSRLLLLLIWVSVWSSTYAVDYHFRAMTADDGLAQNYVDYIFKDSKGFMWFATWCGLDRFDGYEIQHHNIEDGKMISNFTYCLEEDNFERLWIGTDMGLSVIDLNTGDYIDVFDAVFQYESLFSGSILSMLNDSKGRLWIAGEHGVASILFDESGKILNIYTLNTLPVQTLAEDKDAHIWLGMSSGQLLMLSDAAVGRFQFETLPDCLSQKTFGQFKCLFFDNMDVLWIGTGNGLFRYNPYVNRLDAFSADQKPSSLPNGTITDIVQDKAGRVWIGTLAGLALWQVDDMSFEIFDTDGTDESINNNYINDLYVDDQNILWIGTDKGGVNWMFEKRKMFNAIKHHPSNPGSIQPAPVNSVLEDSKGNLWVGQVEGGLHKRSKGQKDFKHYYHTNSPNSLSQNTVSKIYEDSQSRMWIGTWGGGLNRLTSKDDFVYYQPNSQEGSILSIFVSDLVEDKWHNGLWVALPNGVQLFDFRTERFENIFSNVDMPYLPEYVNCLYIDSRHRLWIGSNIGLFCIYLKTFSTKSVSSMQYDYYRYIMCDSPIEQLAKVTSIYEAENGTMWFGTNGGGLYKMEEYQGSITDMPDEWKDSYTQKSVNGYVRFFNYSINNGFSDNVIYTIENDQEGNLWMSSNNGLMCFNPRNGECLNFYKNDGLLSNQFYWMAGTKSKDGILYFGNMNGVNTVEPQRFKVNDYMPEVVLLSLSILNEKVTPNQPLNDRIYIDKLISEMDKVTIPKRDKSFSIEFTSMDYEFPEKIQYAYRLKGFEDNWNFVGIDRRYVSYANLKQGDYTFMVRCTNSDGVWSDKVCSLDIRIKPPFVQTLFFQMMMLLMILGFGISIVWIRENRLKKAGLELEQKVKERTAELEEAYQKVESLTQERISIFTNITHEFKTPITLIRGPIRHLLNTQPSPEVAKQLTMVDKNADVLLTLVNQIMDFRKMEEGMMSLNKQRVELVSMLRDMIYPFVDEAGKRNVQCLFFPNMERLDMLTDFDKIQKILTNLLSNAIKFTPANGNIRVEMSRWEKGGYPWLRMSVSDTGNGIPNEEKEKIFECFYQVKDSHRQTGPTGTGIGLFLCRKLSQLLGGNISVVDNPIGGSCFVVEIPLELMDEAAQENASSEKAEVSLEEPTLISSEENVETLAFSDKEEALSEKTNTDENADEDEYSNKSEKPLLLLVEDSTDMRQFIVSFMEDDYTILQAGDGEEGWAMACKYLPDIIISDVMMPRMDGIHLCSLVKNTFDTSHIPLILLTALSSVQHQLEGLKAGADDYVSKPFDEMVLKTKVRNIVERQEKRYHRFEETMNATELMEGEQDADKQLLEKVMSVIEANYMDSVYDVTSFVRDMGLSKSLFFKKIQMLTGQSAGRFIRNYRLNKAKALLDGKSTMNISEIAYSVGFNDPKYFTRCFTKRYGVNPTRYMKVI